MPNPLVAGPKAISAIAPGKPRSCRKSATASHYHAEQAGDLFDPPSDLRNNRSRPNLEQTQAPGIFPFGSLPRDLSLLTPHPVRFLEIPRYSTTICERFCDLICDSLTPQKGATGSPKASHDRLRDAPTLMN